MRILKSLSYSDNITKDINFYYHKSSSIRNETRRNLSFIGTVEQWRASSTDFVYAAQFVVIFSGILTLCCFSRKGIIWTIAIAILSQPLVWLLAGTSMSEVVFLSDMCRGLTLETYLMNKTQEAFGSSENITKYYLKCSGESPFSNLTIFTKEKLLEAETALNLSLQLGEPKDLIIAIEALVEQVGELNDRLADLTNCTKTMTLWNHLQALVCGDIRNNLEVTLAACIIDGILMMAIISIALLLSKEFQVVNEIKYHLVSNKECHDRSEPLSIFYRGDGYPVESL